MTTYGTYGFVAFALVFSSVSRGDEIPYEDISNPDMDYTLPDLGFRVGELEPYIDESTIRAHHGGHHLTYTENLNNVLRQWRTDLPNDALAKASILEILQHIDLVPDKYKMAIQNQGGGYLNHCFYWAGMSGNPAREERLPPAKLAEDIDAAFGSYSNFKNAFTAKAKSLFGSGYVWLSRDQKDALVLTTSANQDSPVSKGLRPILVLDVWEHSYYLRHQFRRMVYVSDWWKVVDWHKVDMLDMWWSDEENFVDEFRDEL